MQPLIPMMTPAPGSRLLRFVGDRVRFELRQEDARRPEAGWRAMLRTDLGRAAMLRREIIEAQTRGVPPAGAAWRDLPMNQENANWTLELPITEPGFFKAKAYLVDPRGWQHWPDGPDAGISVHPNGYRTANTIYCAFTRLFGPTRTGRTGEDAKEKILTSFDNAGYAVIPPSGKIRDLKDQLPHIFDTLGCRMLHLLPIHPTPTTYARFGRFGSPYAALDLTAIDPALVVFDKRTTGIDQFRELAYETHLRDGRLILDIVINHTGWGSVLQETHPEWFVRNPDGTFASPGAWGTIWEDLVELKHKNVELWDQLAEMFLTWCNRGVDGFRCDAAYKVPPAAWQYITARVQEEYPETIFLCEGLGGPWAATETLLTEGGMQWAYSELFQNYSGAEISTYLDHSHAQSESVGLLIHYSETHDNDRLGARGRVWSLLRNRLCGLASNNAGFGFACGVEWLAAEKIKVHGSPGLAWDNPENIVPELAALNRLISEHPCFFDGAKLTRISPRDSEVYGLCRESEEGKDFVVVLVNTTVDRAQSIILEGFAQGERTAGKLSIRSVRSLNPLSPLPDPSPIELGEVEDGAETVSGATDPLVKHSWIDLLGQTGPKFKKTSDGTVHCTLPPGSCYCLAPTAKPLGLSGEAYRRARAQAAWGMQALAQCLPTKSVPACAWRELAELVEKSPDRFLAAVSWLGRRFSEKVDARAFLGEFGSVESLARVMAQDNFPAVIEWSLSNRNRITLVPPGHWVLIRDRTPFRASLQPEGVGHAHNVESIPIAKEHVACLPSHHTFSDATLLLERYAEQDQQLQAALRFLAPEPNLERDGPRPINDQQPSIRATDLVLLTNGRGGMARIGVDLGKVRSKYDCVLAANLHPTLPVDRHVLAKRIRAWINADGFISPLDFSSLASFTPGPPAIWDFVANAGDGRTVQVGIAATMLDGLNTTAFRFSRPTASDAKGKQLPADADVRLTVRLDIEDRNFHSETHRNGGAEYHFSSHCHNLPSGASAGPASPAREERPDASQHKPFAPEFSGFAFTPAADRQLRVFCPDASYQPQPEWSENIPHPVEQSRAQVVSSDAFSPGWFEIPLPKGAEMNLVVTADAEDPGAAMLDAAFTIVGEIKPSDRTTAQDHFETQLVRATSAFVVRRGSGKTVIAGYPWFLDWGRDTFICARGLLAAGRLEDVKQILITFARFEKQGTLPNTIFGEDASNRDTSDAPLWFAVVCEELEALAGGAPETERGCPSRGSENISNSAKPNEPHGVIDGAAAGTAALRGGPLYDVAVDSSRTVRDVLISIAQNYAQGTPNGIRMDAASGLIWSPSHFTWMDTNHPACTPREGYPIEIQALWIRLLRQIERCCDPKERARWVDLAARASASLDHLFWREKEGFYADVLLARAGEPAEKANVDDVLRSNCLFPISLGLVSGARAQRCVQAALRHLVVPGGLRSLAPLPVSVPLPIYGGDGRLLNDPHAPYWGRYEGDEDTRRKPAYHNGTAWGWTLPVFCEALARAWDFSAEAVAAAKAYLGSSNRLLAEGCIGQLPEILDGDAPHTQRGCDAQAWSATEALRVWKLLKA